MFPSFRRESAGFWLETTLTAQTSGPQKKCHFKKKKSLFHHSSAETLAWVNFYFCYFSQLPLFQLLLPVTTGRLMAHPLGAVQRIWSPAPAMAICVHWRCNERERGREREKKKPAGLCSNPPPPGLSHCSCVWVWTAVIWCRPLVHLTS